MKVHVLSSKKGKHAALHQDNKRLLWKGFDEASCGTNRPEETEIDWSRSVGASWCCFLTGSPNVTFLHVLALTSPLAPMLWTAFCFYCGVLITKWLNPAKLNVLLAFFHWEISFLERNGEGAMLGIRLLVCLHEALTGVMAGWCTKKCNVVF